MDQILLQKIDLEIIRSTYCSFNQFQTQYSGLIQANHCTTSHMVHLMFCILIPFDHVLNNETNKTLSISLVIVVLVVVVLVVGKRKKEETWLKNSCTHKYIWKIVTTSTTMFDV